MTSRSFVYARIKSLFWFLPIVPLMRQTTKIIRYMCRKMSSISMMSEVPYGIRLIQKMGGNLFSSHIRVNRQFAYKSSVVVLTYLAYMCYHLTRKPMAVVKAVLHRNCSNLVKPSDLTLNMLHLPKSDMLTGINEETWCDYPPFDGSDSAILLGYMDSAFLFTYGAVMFASGFVAERVSLRYFLSLGMLFSGIFCYLFGIAKTMDIHSIWYFVIVQAMAGIFQTTGWPGVVTILGRWFGKSKRGLIFGIWNSHTSIGNILGSLVAAYYLETDWSLSFIVPGCIMGLMGFVVFLFLVDAPEIVGCQDQQAVIIPSRTNSSSNYQSVLEEGLDSMSTGSSDVDDTAIIVGEQEVTRRPTERTPMLDRRPSAQHNQHDAIGFMGALRIPGVIEFSLCLFFSKLVSYTFLYWLPLYIQSSMPLMRQTTKIIRYMCRKMSSISMMSEVPYGIRLIQKMGGNLFSSHIRVNRQFAYKSSVVVLTYLAYMCYHLTRKPMAVVKAVLHRNCSNLVKPSDLTLNMLHLPKSDMLTGINEETWCDYPPFDGSDSAILLGYMDSAFLFTYGAVMFASGFVAERVSLRYFLSLGMLFSGIFCYLFGIAKTMDIHSIWYFVIVQAMAGIFQTTGWPGVVTILGRWFGKSKRGLIFGIWNSHTSIGNILGSLVAAYYLETDWSLSFIVPGCIMGLMGFVVFLFLVDAPEIVGCQDQQAVIIPSRTNSSSNYQSVLEEGLDSMSTGSSDVDDTAIIVGEQEVTRRPTERTPMLDRRPSAQHNQHDAIGFMGALRIPGVIEFSLCLFFSKLVSYTFLYWLPLYIQSSTTLGATLSADVSTFFDVGGIVGAIAAGVISDYTGMSAFTCAGMLFFAVPMLLVYQAYGALSVPLNIILLFIVGVVVNGPYALITTSVSAELGTHSSLEGNAKALATVTAIIDGTGSIGAAVGPLIAGLVSGSSWKNVFKMLVISDIMAFLLLLRLVYMEFSKRKRDRRIE